MLTDLVFELLLEAMLSGKQDENQNETISRIYGKSIGLVNIHHHSWEVVVDETK